MTEKQVRMAARAEGRKEVAAALARLKGKDRECSHYRDGRPLFEPKEAD